MIQRTHYLETIRQRLKRLFVIHPGKDSYEMNGQTEAVAMANLQARLAQAGIGGKGR